MARVLILSSFVAHGHVGATAAAAALQVLGHSVTVLPTVVLSNHPGWSHVGGARVPVDQLQGMADAIAANGWLGQQDALLTGYLPTPDHVAFAVSLVRRMRAVSPSLRCVVDPVLGDHPKGLYLSQQAAEAVRDDLVPLADILTPNSFELGWLTGSPVTDLVQAEQAARQLAVSGRCLLVTSPPLSQSETGLLRVDSDGITVWSRPFLEQVPHGVGDVFSALVCAGVTPAQALGYLDTLIRHSLGEDHLRIAETSAVWSKAAALAETERAHGL